MRRPFSKPDIHVSSADGSVTCGLRSGEVRGRVDAPLSGHYHTIGEFRAELALVRSVVAEHDALTGLPSGDVDEIAARLHQVMIGGAEGQLNPAQRQVYRVEQSRFTVRRSC